jgi:hypothetical protein
MNNTKLTFLAGAFTFCILAGWAVDSHQWGLSLSFLVCSIVSFLIQLDP